MLIPRLDEMESIGERGEQRMRELAAARGLDREHLTDDERAHLVDEMLHQE